MTFDRDTVSSESTRGIHRISSLMRCPAEYGYRYLLGLEPSIEKEGLALGTCCHLALEAVYRGEPWVSALLDAPARVSFMASKAREIIPRYLARWPLEDPERVVSIEKEYAMTVGDQTFTRRIDRLVVERKKGRDHLVAYDIKTAGRVKQRLGKTLLDPTLFTQEMIGSAVIAPELGMEWGGVILDLIPTNSKDDFVRQPLRWSREMLNRAEQSLLYWMREEQVVLDQWRAGKINPWGLEQTFQCYPQGFTCDYWHLCSGGPTELSRYVRRER